MVTQPLRPPAQGTGCRYQPSVRLLGKTGPVCPSAAHGSGRRLVALRTCPQGLLVDLCPELLLALLGSATFLEGSPWALLLADPGHTCQ